MPDAPYGNPPVGAIYARLIPPKDQDGASRIAAALFFSFTSEALLQVTDGSHYGESEMPSPLQLAAARAPTSYFECTGILFEGEETEVARQCCAFVVSAGMSAYVYLPSAELSVYVWEGDFVELWSPSKAAIAGASSRLVNAGCKVVTAGGG